LLPLLLVRLEAGDFDADFFWKPLRPFWAFVATLVESLSPDCGGFAAASINPTASAAVA
jgi:hypothetical protein